jgi:hypothetical protein
MTTFAITGPVVPYFLPSSIPDCAECDSIAFERDGLAADYYLIALGFWFWFGACGEELEAELRSAGQDFVVTGRAWAWAAIGDKQGGLSMCPGSLGQWEAQSESFSVNDS